VKKIDRAEAIQLAMDIRNKVDALLDVLLPEDLEDGCPHPAEAIQDRSTMDDDGQLYHCTKCGAESATPFPSIISED
jgi:hypothetical protein